MLFKQDVVTVGYGIFGRIIFVSNFVIFGSVLNCAVNVCSQSIAEIFICQIVICLADIVVSIPRRKRFRKQSFVFNCLNDLCLCCAGIDTNSFGNAGKLGCFLAAYSILANNISLNNNIHLFLCNAIGNSSLGNNKDFRMFYIFVIAIFCQLIFFIVRDKRRILLLFKGFTVVYVLGINGSKNCGVKSNAGIGNKIINFVHNGPVTRSNSIHISLHRPKHIV